MCNPTKVAETIKEMSKSKNIMIGALFQECGLSKNTLSTMQSRGYLPRLETMSKIADCLDCSVDYLLGRTENPQSHKCPAVTTGDVSGNYNSIIGSSSDISIHNTVAVSGQATALLEAFNNLNPFNQAKVLVYVDELSKSE